MGDFNAPHLAWGYTRPTKKADTLWDTTQQLNLTILMDPDHPMRGGNSVQRDATPDLTTVKNVCYAQRTNTLEDFGNDHYRVETPLIAGH
ncbi:hypothetical protein HPB48_003140 [Haemaphysalis longicornis]|uniref:Endonuclease/exonuclease/phosphatase domain-containing protein n=1 Tax=Haemaphysalis longicornis TaxID=44386 RepID=A0A9J6GR37_HAELO|nr:hypothetical protein HPB48_003140 [Haemaphysalis longicornis]